MGPFVLLNCTVDCLELMVHFSYGTDRRCQVSGALSQYIDYSDRSSQKNSHGFCSSSLLRSVFRFSVRWWLPLAIVGVTGAKEKVR